MRLPHPLFYLILVIFPTPNCNSRRSQPKHMANSENDDHRYDIPTIVRNNRLRQPPAKTIADHDRLRNMGIIGLT